MSVKKIFLAISVLIIGNNRFLNANLGLSALYNKAAGLYQNTVSWASNNQKSSTVIGVAFLAVATTGLWYWYRKDFKGTRDDEQTFTDSNSNRPLPKINPSPRPNFPGHELSAGTQDVLNAISPLKEVSNQQPVVTNNNSDCHPAIRPTGKNNNFLRLNRGLE